MAQNYAFGHQAGSGKDAVCKVLVEEFGYTRVFFAEPVYRITEAIQEILELPKEKNRALLQFIGEGLREVLGQDIWIRYAMRRITEHLRAGRKICVSDLRYRDEAAALREAGFALVKVERPNRPGITNPTHRSETELIGYDFDFTLFNESTLNELQEQVRTLAQSE